jgi:hypothetical protein
MHPSLKFYSIYGKYFYISKFLIRMPRELFNIDNIKYTVDINKISLLNLFLIFLLLFGQIPKLIIHTKQFFKKLKRYILIITQTSSHIYINIRKFIHFLFIYSAIEMIIISKMKENEIDNILVKNNNFFSELIIFPGLYINFYHIFINIELTKKLKNSFLEKITFLRFLQLPVSFSQKSHLLFTKKI